MSDSFYKVEFDPSYQGGDYTGQGNHVLVPEDQVIQFGMGAAFEAVTGHSRVNIVHYSEDLRFDKTGAEIQIPQDEVVQLPVEPVIQLAEEPTTVVTED
jgi:hypothetical protein